MKRDMRRTPNKQHLGTAQKRDAYERTGNVVLSDNRVKRVEPVKVEPQQTSERSKVDGND